MTANPEPPVRIARAASKHTETTLKQNLPIAQLSRSRSDQVLSSHLIRDANNGVSAAGRMLGFIFKKGKNRSLERNGFARSSFDVDRVSKDSTRDEDDRHSISSQKSTSSLKSMIDGKKGIFGFRGKKNKGKTSTEMMPTPYTPDLSEPTYVPEDVITAPIPVETSTPITPIPVPYARSVSLSPLSVPYRPPARSSSLEILLPTITPVSGSWSWTNENEQQRTSSRKDRSSSTFSWASGSASRPTDLDLNFTDSRSELSQPDKLDPAQELQLTSTPPQSKSDLLTVKSAYRADVATAAEPTFSSENPPEDDTPADKLPRKTTTSSIRSARSTLSDGLTVVPDVLSPARKPVVSIAGTTIETDDPSHLFWVPAHLHPELYPGDFSHWLDAGGPSSTESSIGATGKASLKRSKSFVERHVVITPDNLDDFVDKESVLPRSRTVTGAADHQRTGKGLPPLKRSRHIRPKRSTARSKSADGDSTLPPAANTEVDGLPIEEASSSTRRRSWRKSTISVHRKRTSYRKSKIYFDMALKTLESASSIELDTPDTNEPMDVDRSLNDSSLHLLTSEVMADTRDAVPDCAEEAEDIINDGTSDITVLQENEIPETPMDLIESVPVDTATKKAKKHKRKSANVNLKKNGNAWKWFAGFLGKKNAVPKKKQKRRESLDSLLSDSDTDDLYGSSQSGSLDFIQDGVPRYPLDVEKNIYQASHIKLAQFRRPLQQQVLISNLMRYILSVHMDVTLQRPTPRKAKGRRGRRRGGSPTAPGRSTSRSPGRAAPLVINANSSGPRTGSPNVEPGGLFVPLRSPVNENDQTVPTSSEGANAHAGRQHNLAHLAAIKSGSLDRFDNDRSSVGRPPTEPRDTLDNSDGEEDEDDVPLGMLQHRRGSVASIS
ncbi:hypothetical protein HDU85_003131 [Gaertneriomyces sp. JEL0708]|nr:hypothetical protein HDU85_003131 [Gaertneriomyces sp. JEL0708]